MKTKLQTLFSAPFLIPSLVPSSPVISPPSFLSQTGPCCPSRLILTPSFLCLSQNWDYRNRPQLSSNLVYIGLILASIQIEKYFNLQLFAPRSPACAASGLFICGLKQSLINFVKIPVPLLGMVWVSSHGHSK